MYKLLYIVPKNLVSFVLGQAVGFKLPSFLNEPLKKWFVKRYQLDMNEAEFSLNHYDTLGDLFVRKLKPGIRPLGEGYVHPCDGELTRGGLIEQGQLIQAKGKTYSLKKFLADIEGWEAFQGGQYLTYYLCPRDYHRVHSPVSGKILSCTHVPGKLWPVNPWSVENITQLFAINERTLTLIETDRGLVMVVMVGATNVGKMTMSFDREIVTNASHFRSLNTKEYHPTIDVEKGQELGIFNMGSTVIVLTTPSFFANQQPEIVKDHVKYGESLKFKKD